MIVGYHGLAEQRLDDGRTEQLGDLDDFVARAERALAGEDGDALAAVEDVERARDAVVVRHALAVGFRKRYVVRDVAAGWLGFFEALLLHVHRNRHVRHRALRHGDAAREGDGVVDVRRAHDARRIGGDVGEQLAEIDVLLREGVDEIVIGQAGHRDHWRLVELGVVEPIQQVDAARSAWSPGSSLTSRSIWHARRP